MSIRIVLADDHKIFLDGLRGLLENQSNLDVIAGVSDGLDAVKTAQQKNPDIVIMDLSMPGMNGIEATRQIKNKQPEVKVICLTMHSSEELVGAAFQASASSYMLKTCDLNELIRPVPGYTSKLFQYSRPTFNVDKNVAFPAERRFGYHGTERKGNLLQDTKK